MFASITLPSRQTADSVYSGLTVYALPLLSAFLDVSGQLLLVAAYAVCGMESTPSASTAGDPDMSSVSDVTGSALETVTEAVRRRWIA